VTTPPRHSEAVRARQAHPAPAPPTPLRVPVTDSHTHLDMQATTVDEAIGQAAAVGVTRLVQVGADVASSRWSAKVAAKHEQVWATAALHPNEAPRLGDLDAALTEIDALAGLPQVCGVGETGLDYFRTGPEGVPVQERAFRAHVEMAKRHGKALVIHDRDAHADVLRVLAEEGPPDRVVFHCFSGDADLAGECAVRGYFMSFAGNVTFATAQALRDAVAVAPLELLLVETDAPFLTPVPYRGRANAPYLVPLTVRAMAQARGVDEDTLAAAVDANAGRVFGLS
jgi:TatD DNase family protein